MVNLRSETKFTYTLSLAFGQGATEVRLGLRLEVSWTNTAQCNERFVIVSRDFTTSV